MPKRLKNPTFIGNCFLKEIDCGAEICSQTHCKYLGVYLNAKLTFKKHTEHVTKKLNKFCGIVYRIRDRFPQKCILSFYYAYVRSVITYGLINYGSTYKTNLEPIHKAQRRIFRAIFHRRQWDTLQDVYTKHKFLNFYEMFIGEMMNEVFIQLRLESPRVYLDTSLGGHDYNTRNQSRICGKGVGLSLFPSDSLSFESYEQFVRKSKKSKK